MKRTGFKRKKTKPLKRTKLRKKSRSEICLLKEELWQLCKMLTRKIFGYNCYTCGDYVEFPHTGHFITDSICSTELSYDLRNLRPQCYRCNIHLSGNWVAYEDRMIKDNGIEYVKELKERNQKTKGLKYDELWFKAKIKEYQELLNNMN